MNSSVFIYMCVVSVNHRVTCWLWFLSPWPFSLPPPWVCSVDLPPLIRSHVCCGAPPLPSLPCQARGRIPENTYETRYAMLVCLLVLDLHHLYVDNNSRNTTPCTTATIMATPIDLVGMTSHSNRGLLSLRDCQLHEHWKCMYFPNNLYWRIP